MVRVAALALGHLRLAVAHGLLQVGDMMPVAAFPLRHRLLQAGDLRVARGNRFLEFCGVAPMAGDACVAFAGGFFQVAGAPVEFPLALGGGLREAGELAVAPCEGLRGFGELRFARGQRRPKGGDVALVSGFAFGRGVLQARDAGVARADHFLEFDHVTSARRLARVRGGDVAARARRPLSRV